MSKSLSELMSSPDVGRPEDTFPICVSGKLAGELKNADADYIEAEAAFEKARDELEDAKREAEQRRDGERPSLRLGERSPVQALEAKVAELDEAASEKAATCDAIRARMQEHTITLHLRGKRDGEWRRWANAHPARDEDEDRTGSLRDRSWAGMYCNIDALIADLGGYDLDGEHHEGFIAKYGDEDPTENSWRFVVDNAAPGDLTRLASVVTGMHEQGVDLGKSRVALRTARRSVSDSN